MVKELMVRGLNIMVVMAWTMVKLGWVLFRSSPFSWPLKLLELLWVRFVFVFLKHEMENINAGYVIPFEYYKVRPVEKLLHTWENQKCGTLLYFKGAMHWHRVGTHETLCEIHVGSSIGSIPNLFSMCKTYTNLCGNIK